MNQDFQDILSAFCDEGVEFLLVGAYALAVLFVEDLQQWALIQTLE